MDSPQKSEGMPAHTLENSAEELAEYWVAWSCSQRGLLRAPDGARSRQ